MYIINLSSQEHKYKDTVECLRGISHLVNFVRIDAIDTRSMNVEALGQVFIREEMHCPPDLDAVTRGVRLKHHELTSGSCGCLLSHTMRAWKTFVNDSSKKESDIAIFAEDDICMSRGAWQPGVTAWFLNTIRENLECMNTCDILLLSRGKQQNKKLTKFATRESVISFFGLWAYILTKRSARKLLHLIQCSSIDMQLDWKLSQFAQQGKIVIEGFTQPLFDVRGLLSTTQACQVYIGDTELYHLVQ